MSEKRVSPGKPITYMVEAGPFTHYGFGKGDIARMERETQREIDRAVRGVLRLGPYSKVVRTSRQP